MRPDRAGIRPRRSSASTQPEDKRRGGGILTMISRLHKMKGGASLVAIPR